MKLNLIMTQEAKVITKKSSEYDMNGRKGISYVLGLKIGNDLDEIGCTEDLFGKVQEDKTYIFTAGVNTSYQNQKIKLETIFDNAKPQHANAK